MWHRLGNLLFLRHRYRRAIRGPAEKQDQYEKDDANQGIFYVLKLVRQAHWRTLRCSIRIWGLKHKGPLRLSVEAAWWAAHVVAGSLLSQELVWYLLSESHWLEQFFSRKFESVHLKPKKVTSFFGVFGDWLKGRADVRVFTADLQAAFVLSIIKIKVSCRAFPIEASANAWTDPSPQTYALISQIVLAMKLTMSPSHARQARLLSISKHSSGNSSYDFFLRIETLNVWESVNLFKRMKKARNDDTLGTSCKSWLEFYLWRIARKFFCPQQVRYPSFKHTLGPLTLCCSSNS